MSKIEVIVEAWIELSNVTPNEFMTLVDHPYWDALRGVWWGGR